jgi:CheY-like chemotaxis protein
VNGMQRQPNLDLASSESPMSLLRILVVDDDRSHRQIVGRILGARGYQVATAEGGAEALKLLSSGNFDLAIIDYLMPDMDGVQTFREARKIRPDLLGIFLTAHANINTIFPAVDAGIERVLAKPANADELMAVVDELLGEQNST